MNTIRTSNYTSTTYRVLLNTEYIYLLRPDILKPPVRMIYKKDEQ